MLDEKDLGVLKNMLETVIDGRVSKTEEHILEEVDKRVSKTEEHILEEVDKKIFKSEKIMLDEIERARKGLEKHIQQVQKNIDELNQYYRITKLENDNTTLLLKVIDELSKRVEELEKRIA